MWQMIVDKCDIILVNQIFLCRLPNKYGIGGEKWIKIKAEQTLVESHITSVVPLSRKALSKHSTQKK